MTKFVLVAAGIALVGVSGLLIDGQSQTPVSRPVEQSGEYKIFALGRVEGSTPEIELRPQLAGRIVEVLVQEGQFVEQGQILLRLDDAEYRHQVALAAAEVELAEAQLGRLLNGAHSQERTQAAALYRAKQAELEGAQLSWKRIQQLSRVQAVSQQQADNQKTAVAALVAEVAAAKAHLQRLESPARQDEIQMNKARIEAAKARLELARVQLQRAELRSPHRGQVLKIDVEAGELTGPTSAEPAVVLADTTRFQVRAFVEEMDAPRVKVGMTAKIVADGLPDQEFTGRVTRLSPRMCRKQLWTDQPTERYDTKMREVWFELEEAAEALVVGLRVDLTIDPESPAPAELVKSDGSNPSDHSPPESPSTPQSALAQR